MAHKEESRLTWIAVTEGVDGGLHLLLTDALVLLSFGARLETLPGEAASEEVHQHVAQRLHVVAARLFYRKSKVRGGGG